MFKVIAIGVVLATLVALARYRWDYLVTMGALAMVFVMLVWELLFRFWQGALVPLYESLLEPLLVGDDPTPIFYTPTPTTMELTPMMIYFMIVAATVILVTLIVRCTPSSRIIYSPEAMVHGSAFEALPPPKCQVTLVAVTGTEVSTGQGALIKYGEGVAVVTALHVVKGASVVLAENREGLSIRLGARKVIHQDGVAFPVEAAQMSRLGVRVGQTTVVTSPVAASAHGVMGRSSGCLMQISDGLLSYQGSTQPGYSGAPVMVGGKVAGIHIGTVEGRNLAFDISLAISRSNDYRYNPEAQTTSEMTPREKGYYGGMDARFKKGLAKLEEQDDQPGSWAHIPEEIDYSRKLTFENQMLSLTKSVAALEETVAKMDFRRRRGSTRRHLSSSSESSCSSSESSRDEDRGSRPSQKSKNHRKRPSKHLRRQASRISRKSVVVTVPHPSEPPPKPGPSGLTSSTSGKGPAHPKKSEGKQ
ncbi:hypothetical protein 1 [Wenling sobemo-like virus 2]|uniref:hypothetical protein 1 n=1 Tax=Wenling sobemo-like virus 2 TaxID=1923541 RepID=UPI00090B57A8|nr:hypothetical protein 1 [Wenling sobemo-like virus 2]APG75956.1 hypothetical protein 1 [Wenling sobemo-like virus 2]